MALDELTLQAEESMDKALDYLKGEMRGIRTGRASTAMVEFVKVDYYGSMTDMRSLALISVPEPTQLLIKPYDASSLQACVKGIQEAGLGINPIVDGKQIRINLPALTGDRRKQLAQTVKQMGEQAKVSMRNARRDTNRHIDQFAKDKPQGVSEDDFEQAKEEVQDLLRRYEGDVDKLTQEKIKEIEEL